MRRLAHIINPVQVAEASDLFVAQPITFASMEVARQFAQDQVQVELFCTHYPEDQAIAPSTFQPTPNLERSVLEVRSFRTPRKLPLLQDILDRLYHATDADYLIYTNVDIALMPHFYVTVNALLDQGCDACAINRRTISAQYRSPDDLPLMYAQVGEPHGGHDCFVFSRTAYPNYHLGKACIGAGRIGKVMLLNLMSQAANFQELTDAHLTFHLGNEEAWKQETVTDYFEHNERELVKLLQHCIDEGCFPDHLQMARLIQRYHPQLTGIPSTVLRSYLQQVPANPRPFLSFKTRLKTIFNPVGKNLKQNSKYQK